MTFIIGQDIDGVCYHWEKTARYMLREKLKREGRLLPPLLLVASQSWNAIQECGITEDDWRWLWSDGVRDGLFRYGHVISGSIEGVQALAELGDVVAITTRPKQAVRDTLDWLSLHFDKAPLSGLNILSHGQLKSDVRPLPNVYIDDAAHNVEDILANTPGHVRVVLFDQPWNRAFDEASSSRVERARGWSQVVALVRSAKAGGPWEVAA